MPEIGQCGVVRTGGWAAARIRWVTRSDFNHAFVYVGDGQVIEAQPAGALLADATDYPDTVWSRWDLLGHGQRVADAARSLAGTPYSFVDVAAIGLADMFGIRTPEAVRQRLNRAVPPNVQRLMCSQLVDTAYLLAGLHLFDDGRPAGDVSPGDLAQLILSGKQPKQ